MNDRNICNQQICLEGQISVYLDGEMSRDETALFEIHLENCSDCRRGLNRQKAFLIALSNTLADDYRTAVPRDFVRTIVASAESGVSGLRKRREMISAAAVIVVLLTATVLLASGEVRTAFSSVGEMAARVSVLASLIVRTAYNLIFGATHLLRISILSQPMFAAVVVLAAAVTSIFAIRRLSGPIERFFKIHG